MILVIAEKPSVAQTIAAVLGAKEKKDGFLTGSGYLVSWCVGHLVGLAEAATYGEQYKKWSYDSLGHFPTSNFQPTHRRTGGRKYGKGYSFPMLAKKVFSSLTTTTKLPVCQKKCKRKTPQSCDASITLCRQKRGNFIPPSCRCWLPLCLLQ